MSGRDGRRLLIAVVFANSSSSTKRSPVVSGGSAPDAEPLVVMECPEEALLRDWAFGADAFRGLGRSAFLREEQFWVSLRACSVEHLRSLSRSGVQVEIAPVAECTKGCCKLTRIVVHVP